MTGGNYQTMCFLNCVHRLLLNDVQQGKLRGSGVSVDEIHDLALMFPDNADMRIGREIPDSCGMPMVSAGKSRIFVHPLLDNGPFSIGRNYKCVKINLKAVRDRVVVDSGRKTARPDESLTIEAPAIRNSSQLARRVPGMPAAAAADVDAEFVRPGV